mmetsp:Transcript_33217/g.63775  ORF Transcript_33217/g.63775 Transcript_33217/m.63775 type:complete len:212 (-) Transcript_33217:2714-3349(-)
MCGRLLFSRLWGGLLQLQSERHVRRFLVRCRLLRRRDSWRRSATLRLQQQIRSHDGQQRHGLRLELADGRLGSTKQQPQQPHHRAGQRGVLAAHLGQLLGCGGGLRVVAQGVRSSHRAQRGVHLRVLHRQAHEHLLQGGVAEAPLAHRPRPRLRVHPVEEGADVAHNPPRQAHRERAAAHLAHLRAGQGGAHRLAHLALQAVVHQQGNLVA